MPVSQMAVREPLDIGTVAGALAALSIPAIRSAVQTVVVRTLGESLNVRLMTGLRNG